MRVVMFGMACAASAPALAALLAAGVDVPLLVVGEVRRAGEAAGFGAAGDSAPERLANAAGLPAIRCGRVDAALIETIGRLDPDAVAVACFPFRLPPALLALPRLGCFDVHPSLLPRGRGPEPVFWTLRRGERETGATVFRMNDRFDAGPIVAQARLPVSPGVRAPTLERDLMTLGGRLLVESLPRLAAGGLEPVAQDDALATDAPAPAAADWLMATSLPAGWAWAFARGVAPLAGPLAVQVGRDVFPVRDAIDHDPAASLAAPIEFAPDGTLRARFRPGWVRFVR
ncbi:MAG TPA: formyltransferase family protein [Thermomicrobiales bacterium]|nr:formyltransferase family protein [Thermomicrobiales bacterium]